MYISKNVTCNYGFINNNTIIDYNKRFGDIIKPNIINMINCIYVTNGNYITTDTVITKIDSNLPITININVYIDSKDNIYYFITETQFDFLKETIGLESFAISVDNNFEYIDFNIHYVEFNDKILVNLIGIDYLSKECDSFISLKDNPVLINIPVEKIKLLINDEYKHIKNIRIKKDKYVVFAVRFNNINKEYYMINCENNRNNINHSIITIDNR